MNVPCEMKKEHDRDYEKNDDRIFIGGGHICTKSLCNFLSFFIVFFQNSWHD